MALSCGTRSKRFAFVPVRQRRKREKLAL